MEEHYIPSGLAPDRGAYDDEDKRPCFSAVAFSNLANNISQQSQDFFSPEESSTTWLLPTALDWPSNEYTAQASRDLFNTPHPDQSNRFIHGMRSSSTILTGQSLDSSSMFLNDDLIAYWNLPFDPNNSIREHPASEDGSVEPSTKPNCLQDLDEYSFHDKVDLVQSSDCQDTISDDRISPVQSEVAINPHGISLQHYQDFENYEAIPDTRVIARRAKKSRPSRSVRATKLSLQNQEDISRMKSTKHTLVGRKYRDKIADKFDALLRVLPIQTKAQIKGYSGHVTSERSMKRSTVLGQAKAYIDSLEKTQQALEEEHRHLSSREQNYIHALRGLGVEAIVGRNADAV